MYTKLRSPLHVLTYRSVYNDVSGFNVYPTHRLQRWIVRPRLTFVAGVCAADFRGCRNRWYCVSLLFF